MSGCVGERAPGRFRGTRGVLGVRRDVLDELHGRGIPTRVYVTYGPDWYRYWLRRVAESRGA